MSTAGMPFTVTAFMSVTVATAAMAAANMSFAVSVMIAMHVGIIAERAADISVCGVVRAAVHTAVQLYTCVGESGLCASAYSSANQNVRTVCGKKSHKLAVSLAIGGSDNGILDFSVFRLVEFKLFGSSEMLKYASVFIRYCNYHNTPTRFLSEFIAKLLTVYIIASRLAFDNTIDNL